MLISGVRESAVIFGARLSAIELSIVQEFVKPKDFKLELL